MLNQRITRRTFTRNALAVIAATAAGAVLGSKPLSLLAQDLPKATLKLGAGPAGPTVPQDFIGLSYEVMQLEDPTFFSPKNVGLVQQFRALAPQGVLRLGGNTSEFSWWKANATDTAPVRQGNVNDPGEAPPPPRGCRPPAAEAGRDGGYPRAEGISGRNKLDLHLRLESGLWHARNGRGRG